MVKLGKEDFIGKDALLGFEPKRKIVAIEMPHGIPRERYRIFKGIRDIGAVTSGTFSPTFRKAIGLAMIDIEGGKIGNEVLVEIRGKMHKAYVVEKPFYKFHGKV